MSNPSLQRVGQAPVASSAIQAKNQIYPVDANGGGLAPPPIPRALV